MNIVFELLFKYRKIQKAHSRSSNSEKLIIYNKRYNNTETRRKNYKSELTDPMKYLFCKMGTHTIFCVYTVIMPFFDKCVRDA